MSWQRTARIVLGLAGIAAAVAVFTMARDREAPPPPITMQPSDRSIVTDGGATTATRMSGSFEEARWSFDRFAEYDDNSSRFWGVVIEFIEDGVEIRADEVFQHPPRATPDAPRLTDLTGNVFVRTSDGLELTTAVAHYDQATGIVTMPEAVAFSRDRVTGSGSSAVYDRRQELFRIDRDAQVDVAPGDDGEFVKATGGSMVIARSEQFLRLETEARIARSNEVLAGDTATIYFVDETDQVRQVDLRGRASVTSPPGATNPPPDMRGDAIALLLHAESRALSRATLVGNASLVDRGDDGTRTIRAPWIDVTTADDGRTVTGLSAREGVRVEIPPAASTPARTITAPTLNATGSATAGLQRARFEGGVRWEEQGSEDAARTGQSASLELQLAGGLDDIRDAAFAGDVRFVDAETVATADAATYRTADDILVLRSPGTGSRRPRVEAEGVTIDAADMTLDLESNRIDASGDVRTRTEPDPDGTEGGSSPFFKSGEVTIGSAPSLVYVSNPARAVYTGSEDQVARLLQGESRLEAGLIEIDEESGNLRAEGSVVSTFLVDDPEAEPGAPPARYEVAADSLQYDDATRQAVYRGTPATMTSGDASSEAETLVLTLADDNDEIQHVSWEGAVYVMFEGVYEAMGSNLQYEAASGRYVLRGRPAVTKLPQEGQTLCHRQTGNMAEFNRRTGDAEWPPSQNLQVTGKKIECRTSIR